MNRRVKQALSIIFISMIVVFFAIYLQGIDYRKLASLQFNAVLLIAATAISLSFRYWGVYIWQTILKDLGATSMPHFSLLANVYGKAWMARYIPGTVTWIAGKVYMASKLGISKSRLTVSSLLEGGVQVVASLVVSLALLALDPRLDVFSGWIKLAMLCLALALLIVLYPPILTSSIRRAYRLFRNKEPYAELRSNTKATVRSFGLYSIGALIAGTSYYLLTSALYPSITLNEFWYIVGSFTLAGAVGMATPFVPSGLGVRDGVQLVLLSQILPKEIALAITVASRLWSAVVDVLFYLLTRFSSRS